MRRAILLITVVGIVNMAVFANTLKGFMPGNINRQNVTQEPGSFGTYMEREKVLNTKYGPKTVYDTGFVKTIKDKPFDIEKDSEMPIRPTIKLTEEQKFNSIFNHFLDDRSKLEVKTGPKSSRISNINLPQR